MEPKFTIFIFSSLSCFFCAIPASVSNAITVLQCDNLCCRNRPQTSRPRITESNALDLDQLPRYFHESMTSVNDTNYYYWNSDDESCLLLDEESGFWYRQCLIRKHVFRFYELDFDHLTGKPYCVLDAECKQTELGQLAWCDLKSCTCGCLPGSKVAEVGASECVIQREQNEICEPEPVEEAVAIDTGPASASASCQCKPSALNRTRYKCLQVSRRLEEDSCGKNWQCLSLDRLAMCDTGRKVCICSNGTAAHEGKCYRRGRYSESCDEDIECRLGLGEEAECAQMALPADLSRRGKICVCAVYNNITGRCEESAPAIPSTPDPLPPSSGPQSRQNMTPAVNTNSSNSDWVTPTIIATALFIIAVVWGFLLLYYKVKRQSTGTRHGLELQSTSTFSSNSSTRTEPSSPQLLFQDLLAMAGLELAEDDFEIDRKQELGSGRSGIVYRGYFKKLSLHVAVKTNRDLVFSEQFLRAILEEAKVLSYLGEHLNLVRFYGVCQATIAKGNVYLLSEICAFGSLESFLRGRRDLFKFVSTNVGEGHLCENRQRPYCRLSKFVDAASPSGPTPAKLGPVYLYNWAHQIASAMEFVSSRKVVHSDLATRNVLLHSLDCIKLTDFGLSHRLYESYTYMKTEVEPLPWKWLDHDALRFMLFTTATDVWSFGITIWEMWTLGEVPYPGIMSPWSENFVGRLLEGFHPCRPEHASEELYEIMVRCWNPNKKERPSFTWLKETLAAQMRRHGFGNETAQELDGCGYLLPITHTT